MARHDQVDPGRGQHRKPDLAHERPRLVLLEDRRVPELDERRHVDERDDERRRSGRARRDLRCQPCGLLLEQVVPGAYVGVEDDHARGGDRERAPGVVARAIAVRVRERRLAVVVAPDEADRRGRPQAARLERRRPVRPVLLRRRVLHEIADVHDEVGARHGDLRQLVPETRRRRLRIARDRQARVPVAPSTNDRERRRLHRVAVDDLVAQVAAAAPLHLGAVQERARADLDRPGRDAIAGADEDDERADEVAVGFPLDADGAVVVVEQHRRRALADVERRHGGEDVQAGASDGGDDGVDGRRRRDGHEHGRRPGRDVKREVDGAARAQHRLRVREGRRRAAFDVDAHDAGVVVEVDAKARRGIRRDPVGQRQRLRQVDDVGDRRVDRRAGRPGLGRPGARVGVDRQRRRDAIQASARPPLRRLVQEVGGDDAPVRRDRRR